MRCLLVLALSTVALGQGIDPRPTPDDYPARAEAGNLTIAAQYHYRSFRAGTQSHYVKRYLVIEAAVYGTQPGSMNVSSGNFTLRLNGKKSIAPQSPGMISYEERMGGSEPRAVIAVPGGGIVLGGPQGRRFPDDRRTPPEVEPPYPGDKAEQSQTPEKPSQAELITQTAFPYGERRLPIAGYVYFPYEKKLKKIKRLELLYKGPAGEAVLQLK